LDSEENFKDEKNFAVVITKKGAQNLKEAGITAPADHYKDRTIRATGTVSEVDGIPRIEINDAKQIRIVQQKAGADSGSLTLHAGADTAPAVTETIRLD